MASPFCTKIILRKKSSQEPSYYVERGQTESNNKVFAEKYLDIINRKKYITQMNLAMEMLKEIIEVTI